MNLDQLRNQIEAQVKRVSEWVREDKRRGAGLGALIAVLAIYGLSKGEEKVSYIFESQREVKSENRDIIENPYKTIYEGKLGVLEQTEKSIKTDNGRLREEIRDLREAVKELIENKRSVASKENESVKAEPPVSPPAESSTPESASEVSVGNAPFSDSDIAPMKGPIRESARSYRKRRNRGRSRTVFPVKMEAKKQEAGVVLGIGSWALGTIIAGAEIPQQKTYPILIQLDQSYSMASKKRLSLVGCLMVARASTVMSTRHVEIQPESIGCFSKSGRYFEEKGLNGWGTDSLDSNFGVKGIFRSNVGRLAEYTFIKSVLEGAQEIISRKSKIAGGANPDRADVMVQQGAAGTSTMVADFLMRQARALLPTLTVNSGRKVYIVMKDAVRLPYEFFEGKDEANEEFDFSFNILN